MNRVLIGTAAGAALAASLLGAELGSAAAELELARDRMVEELRRDEGVENGRVLDALRGTPRHLFVPRRLRSMAYHDMALPIGHGQTISPPSMVGGMLERLDLRLQDRVLEVGTGTGYQAAVLSRLAGEVYTIEIVRALARRAEATLKRLGLHNVHVRTGDGYLGWPEQAPFDRIIVACSPGQVPPPLIDQLKEGGKMIIPIGSGYDQLLYLLTKVNGELVREAVAPTVFVPMTGRAHPDRESPATPVEPSLINGSFENMHPKISRPTGWYHQRQMTLVSDTNAPDGGIFASFENISPSRTAEASQAFGLDGRRYHAVVLSGMVAGNAIARGPGAREQASMVIAFYGANRQLLDVAATGDWLGTFGWRRFEERVLVPGGAREAILRIGLCGATGRMTVDGLRLSADE